MGFKTEQRERRITEKVDIVECDGCCKTAELGNVPYATSGAWHQPIPRDWIQVRTFATISTEASGLIFCSTACLKSKADKISVNASACVAALVGASASGCTVATRYILNAARVVDAHGCLLSRPMAGR